MKFATTLFAALLLTAQIAQAKPPKAKPVAEKEAFTCSVTSLEMLGVPGQERVDYIAIVRMGCTNTGSKPVRIKVSDVFVTDSYGEEYEPSRHRDIFDSYFEDEDPGPMYAQKVVDVAPGKTVDFGFTFDDVGEYGYHLVLDMNGTKYPLPTPPRK